MNTEKQKLQTRGLVTTYLRALYIIISKKSNELQTIWTEKKYSEWVVQILWLLG